VATQYQLLEVSKEQYSQASPNAEPNPELANYHASQEWDSPDNK
jgi:hypothetical protein